MLEFLVADEARRTKKKKKANQARFYFFLGEPAVGVSPLEEEVL